MITRRRHVGVFVPDVPEYLVVRCNGSPDVDIETGMRPGEDKLHAFPIQKLALAQESKDLDLKELAEHALIPGRHRAPDTAAVPSPRCHERVQVRVKPNSLAEGVLIGNRLEESSVW